MKPKFVDGVFVSASFGVPVRSTTRMVIKGEPMYDARRTSICLCLSHVCVGLRACTGAPSARLHGCTLLEPTYCSRDRLLMTHDSLPQWVQRGMSKSR